VRILYGRRYVGFRPQLSAGDDPIHLAISEESDGLLHVIGAVVGFWGLWAYCVVLTTRLYFARLRLRIEKGSLIVKAFCVAGALASLTAFGIVATELSFVDPNVHTVCAIFEWTAAACLGVFQVSGALLLHLDLPFSHAHAQISLGNEILMELNLNALDPSTKRNNNNYEYQALLS
jgi:hypothetical protein